MENVTDGFDTARGDPGGQTCANTQSTGVSPQPEVAQF